MLISLCQFALFCTTPWHLCKFSSLSMSVHAIVRFLSITPPRITFVWQKSTHLFFYRTGKDNIMGFDYSNYWHFNSLVRRDISKAVVVSVFTINTPLSLSLPTITSGQRHQHLKNIRLELLFRFAIAWFNRCFFCIYKIRAEWKIDMPLCPWLAYQHFFFLGNAKQRKDPWKCRNH